VTFESYSNSRVELFNVYLNKSLQTVKLSASVRFSPLIEAMQYSLESGGKRLRPLLVVASAECLGIASEKILPAACAIEYIHTYSLIHDDLPALDDDDMRRGKPSNHVKFGEAVAILAGDALLTEAFGQILHLTENGFAAANVMGALSLLVHNAGVGGLVGGQLLDVTTDHPTYSLPELEFIHIHKTGALILASVLLPTKLVPTDETRIQAFRRYGEAIGLAFQISDDLLDAEDNSRYARGPRKKPKPSYTRVVGRSDTREKLGRLIDSAIQAVESEGERARPLVLIAEFIRKRKH